MRAHLKYKMAVTVVAATMVLASLTQTGCSSLRRVTGDEFVRAAERIGEVHSGHCTSYIGSNGARAHIEHWRPRPHGTKRTSRSQRHDQDVCDDSRE